MKTNNRRSIFRKMFAGLLGVTGTTIAANAASNNSDAAPQKEVFNVPVSYTHLTLPTKRIV